jgi:hypothetical protein
MSFSVVLDAALMRILTAVGASLAITTFVIFPRLGVASDEVVTKALQSVVPIYSASTEETKKPNGTGFFITPDGYLLTAFHVVDQSSPQYKGGTFKLRLLSGKEFEARFIAQSEYLDVALLKIIPPTDTDLLSEIKPLPLNEKSKDKRLTVLGNPVETRPKLFDQTNVGLSDPDRSGLETVTPDLEAGYSGGPVIDDAGSVVGIALMKSDSSAVTFVRKIDTLSEFLESNGLVHGGLGYEKHLSLSSLATAEQVALLEKQLKTLKEEEQTKQKLMDELQDQLLHMKSQVQWDLLICEIQRPANVFGAAQTSDAQDSEPRHRLKISYNKGNIDIMLDAKGMFVAKILPMISGETLADAAKREGLTMSKHFTFAREEWIDDELDDDVDAQVRTYNDEAREQKKDQVDLNKIEGFVISLIPPPTVNDMKYFRFSDKLTSSVRPPKCGVQQ